MPIIRRYQLLLHPSSLACLSYDRVMDVQNDFRRVVSKRVTGDSVVVPTNIKSCVFSQKLSATSMRQVDMSSMALPRHWPAISHMTKLEKNHHLSSWIFPRANISSSLLVMPLCPSLMNMLVMSTCCPYLILRVDQSWCRVTWRIVAPRCASGRRMKCNIQQPDDIKQWWMVGNSQSSMKKHQRCRNRPCPWPWKQWSL